MYGDIKFVNDINGGTDWDEPAGQMAKLPQDKHVTKDTIETLICANCVFNFSKCPFWRGCTPQQKIETLFNIEVVLVAVT